MVIIRWCIMLTLVDNVVDDHTSIHHSYI
jgi:hypothetical protein